MLVEAENDVLSGFTGAPLIAVIFKMTQIAFSLNST